MKFSFKVVLVAVLGGSLLAVGGGCSTHRGQTTSKQGTPSSKKQDETWRTPANSQSGNAGAIQDARTILALIRDKKYKKLAQWVRPGSMPEINIHDVTISFEQDDFMDPFRDKGMTIVPVDSPPMVNLAEMLERTVNLEYFTTKHVFVNEIRVGGLYDGKIMLPFDGEDWVQFVVPCPPKPGPACEEWMGIVIRFTPTNQGRFFAGLMILR
jgi:hypothetical protein